MSMWFIGKIILIAVYCYIYLWKLCFDYQAVLFANQFEIEQLFKAIYHKINVSHPLLHYLCISII